MLYFLYKTTNLITGDYYIGAHKSLNIDDSYLGSGKILNFAIKKYGRENFSRKILEYFEDEVSMYNREREIVNLDLIKDDNIYNIKIGGYGGFGGTGTVPVKDETGLVFRILKTDPRYVSGELKHCITGQPKSQETKQKISQANKGKLSNIKGKICINKEGVQKFIDVVNLHQFIEDGWIKGNLLLQVPKNDSSRLKFSDKAKERFRNNSHNLKGTSFVNNVILKKNKRIKTELIDSFIMSNPGWTKGRINFKANDKSGTNDT